MVYWLSQVNMDSIIWSTKCCTQGYSRNHFLSGVNSEEVERAVGSGHFSNFVISVLYISLQVNQHAPFSLSLSDLDFIVSRLVAAHLVLIFLILNDSYAV